MEQWKQEFERRQSMKSILICVLLLISSAAGFFQPNSDQVLYLEDTNRIQSSSFQQTNVTQFGFDLPSQLEFSFTDVTMIQDILVSDDGDYYVALTPSGDTFHAGGTSTFQSAGSSENCFVLKFNESGAFKWSKELHSTASSDENGPCTSLAEHDDEIRVVDIGAGSTTSYSWSSTDHHLTVWSLNKSTGSLNWGRGIDLTYQSYIELEFEDRYKTPKLFVTHENLTYITFVTKWGQRSSGSSSYGFTPTGWDNQRAEYSSDTSILVVIKNNNDIRFDNIGGYTHSSKIYDAQLIPGSNDLVFAGYSDDSNYNYPGSNNNFASTTTPFSMKGNAMSYLLIINGTASSSNLYNYTVYPQIPTCYRSGSSSYCQGWDTWELFITHIEAISHQEIFITTEGVSYNNWQARSISFLGQTISIPDLGTDGETIGVFNSSTSTYDTSTYMTYESIDWLDFVNDPNRGLMASRYTQERLEIINSVLQEEAGILRTRLSSAQLLFTRRLKVIQWYLVTIQI